MKTENPIEEIWRIRDQMSAAEGYDMDRLFERLRREQQDYAERLVQPPARRTILRETPPTYGGKAASKPKKGSSSINSPFDTRERLHPG
jgi:hypothetical protein